MRRNSLFTICCCAIFLTILLETTFSGTSIAISEISSDNFWTFKNVSLNFNQTRNFTVVPQYGFNYSDNLVTYWNMNEGSGNILHDLSGCNNTGLIVNAGWVDGKYGSGLSFDGRTSRVSFPEMKINTTASAISFWITSTANFLTNYAKLGIIIGHSGNPYSSYFGLTQGSGSTYHLIGESDTNENYFVSSDSIVVADTWNHIVVNFINSSAITYLNGKQVSEVKGLTNNWTINTLGLITSDTAFSGTLDEFQIYNNSLSESEIASLYSMGEQPSPSNFSNYWQFVDSVSNDTMLINANNVSDDGNSTLVTCSNFFDSDELIFTSNNSARITVWTNLGQPKFTTGVWSSENYTTVLTLNSSFIGKINWNNSYPVALTKSLTSMYAGNATIFSILWADNQGLYGGGYIFSTNNTGQWINSTWAAFSSSSPWGNTTLTLNNTVGISVGFREFANNTLNNWGDSGIYAVKTTVYNMQPTLIPPSTPSSSPSPSSKESPSATITFSPTSSPSPNPSLSIPSQTISLDQLMLVTIFSGAVVTIFGIAFKKGVIKIEFADNTPENSDEDYAI